MKIVTEAPLLNAPTPWLVVICTDSKEPCVTIALPVPTSKQCGVSESLGPRIVAEMPVLVGASNPHGLVKISAVTDVLSGIVLFLMFRTRPVMMRSSGIVTVLNVNNEKDEDVPSPIHPPSLTD